MHSARGHCEYLAQAQQVTSTTHGQYMAKLTDFRKLLLDQTVSGSRFPVADPNAHCMPQEFLNLVEEARSEPHKIAVMEICASLHVYSELLLESFVDMSAKLVKFTMVEKLTENLELKWQ